MPSTPASRPVAVSDLAFRRQFLLGPSAPAALPRWVSHRVDDRWQLVVHPDLPCTRVDADSRSLLLLGFVLDPRHPERGDRAILEEVMRRPRPLRDLLRQFDPLAGRWAAFYLAEGRVTAFHDAAGLRQIHHCRDRDGAVWVGSGAGLLARVTGAPADASRREELQRAGGLAPETNHFWPGTASPFVGIDRLLPNHHLDVASREVTRFWPDARIRPVDRTKAVATCGAMLTGTVSAAVARYPLALAITSGVDSRILLAASREHRDRLGFYTLKKTSLAARSADLRIPRKMLRRAGLRHKVIAVDPAPDGEVVDVLQSTFHPPHASPTRSASALSADPPIAGGEWVTLNGNVCEIARGSYLVRPPGSGSPDPHQLGDATGMGSSAFAVRQFGLWCEGSAAAIEASGIDPWDLFYWEQKMGGWLADVRAEFDVVEEGVTPFNSRSLIECMLGVDPDLRCAPDYLFFRDLIEDLWPELLRYPINPPAGSTVLRKRLRKILPVP